jgi:hypothetical protein
MSDLTATQHARVARTAALLSLTLAQHSRFDAAYNPDCFGGMVGFTDAVVRVAAELEEATDYAMCLGEGIDWYLTVDAVADAWLKVMREGGRPTVTEYLRRWED